MEGLGVFLLIILFFLVISLLRKINRVDEKVNRILLKDAKTLFNKAEEWPEVKKEPIVTEPPKEKPPSAFVEKSYLVEEQPVVEKNPVVEKKEEPTIKAPVEKPKSEAPAVKPKAEPVMAAAAAKPVKVKTYQPPKPPEPPKPSFMERNPDLEKFIGENLLSKIGIVIFVIGMGFLVKLGIENNVITEGMRVGIGVVIGGIMIGIAHRLRESFSTFSSVLIGGALAVLYFTIALAFHEYGLIPQSAAFIIMILITAFGVLLSISYNKITLAVLALIGGFGTPFFLSTGEGNIKVLFSYLLILDIGMLALVYFKKWNIINKLAYGFTYVIFIGVFSTQYIGQGDEHRATLLFFLTAFYLVFFLMNIIYNVKNNRKFQAMEIIMLLSNSAIYFGFGLSLVNDYKEGLFNGLFTALVAVFNFVFAMALYKRNEIDKNLLYLLIGLVLTFVSLIAPIQLDGNYITLFWAIEAVLLLWLSNKSGLKIIKSAAFIINVLMLISLAMDWQQNYAPLEGYVVLNAFLNKAFMTTFVVMASILASMKLQPEDELLSFKEIELPWKTAFLKVLLFVVLYLGVLFELNYQFVRFELVDSLRFILLGIYNFTFVIALRNLSKYNPSEPLRQFNMALSILAIFSYLTAFLKLSTDARDLMITNLTDVSTGFFAHYILFILFVEITIRLYQKVHLQFGFKSDTGKISLWLLSFIAVYVCSTEIGHLSVLYQSDHGVGTTVAYGQAIKSIFPIVWALSALTLMVLGMKFKLKTLRISSLVLFSITIVKLFAYDLKGNSTGKIVSFILLGAILLLISFLYQKLKFIIQDDEDEKND